MPCDWLKKNPRRLLNKSHATNRDVIICVFQRLRPAKWFYLAKLSGQLSDFTLSFCLLLETFNAITSRCLESEPALLLGRTQDWTRENNRYRAHVISSLNLIGRVITLVFVQRHSIEKRLIKDKYTNNLSKTRLIHFYFEIPFSTPNLAFKEGSDEFSRESNPKTEITRTPIRKQQESGKDLWKLHG